MQTRATPYAPVPRRSAPTLPEAADPAKSWIAEIPWDVRILAKICTRYVAVLQTMQAGHATLRAIVDRVRAINEQLVDDAADVDALNAALDDARREHALQIVCQADAMDAHVMACCYAILHTWADPLRVLDTRAAIDAFDAADPSTHVYAYHSVTRPDPIGDMCSDVYTDLLSIGVTTDQIRLIGGRIVEACTTARCGGLSDEATRKAEVFRLPQAGSPT